MLGLSLESTDVCVDEPSSAHREPRQKRHASHSRVLTKRVHIVFDEHEPQLGEQVLDLLARQPVLIAEGSKHVAKRRPKATQQLAPRLWIAIDDRDDQRSVV